MRARRQRRSVHLALLLAAALASPAAAAPAAPLTGTWVGTLRLDGAPRKVALVLHRRAAGEVYGYALGGGPGLTVSGGALVGSRLSFRLHVASPAATRTLVV